MDPMSPSKRACRLALVRSFRVILSVIGEVIVVITVSVALVDLVQYEADHVHSKPVECGQSGCDGFTAGLSGASEHHDTIDCGRYLHRFGKSQEWRRIHQDEIVFLRRFVK